MYQVNSEVIEIVWFEDGPSAKHEDFFKSMTKKFTELKTSECAIDVR